MKKKFDKIIEFFNELNSKELLANVKYVQSIKVLERNTYLNFQDIDSDRTMRDFVSKTDKIHISNKLLKKLEEEFNASLVAKEVTKL